MSNNTTGQKKGFTLDEVQTLKRVLKSKSKKRDLAIFAIGIDTMLRISDIINLKISDISNHKGMILSEWMITQKKTKTALKVAISGDTMQIISDYIASREIPDDFLFPAGKNAKEKTHITCAYVRLLIGEWCEYLGLDSKLYSCHSLRRSRASYIYQNTNNIELVRKLLGHTNPTHTSKYLGLEESKAISLSRANFMN